MASVKNQLTGYAVLMALILSIPVYGLVKTGMNQRRTVNAVAAKVDKKQQLHDAMFRLWIEHGVWTHEYIVATLHDLANAKQAAERLLKNQDDIGSAIAPFYGKKAGAELTRLLKDHILIAVDLVDAVKKNDKAKGKTADQKWHKNAQDIALFLSKANPFWPQQDMVNMLNQHLSLTSQQVVARKSANWQKDIQLYDEILRQLTTMAFMLADGIVQQMPEKFATA